MAGKQFIPHGTAVSFASADVGGLVDIVIPNRTRGQVETTDNDSGGDREFIPGLRDSGEFQIVVKEIHDDAGQTQLRQNMDAAFDAATSEEVVITYPAQADDSSPVQTLTFDAFVINDGGDNWNQQSNEPALRTYSLRVDGGITFASA